MELECKIDQIQIAFIIYRRPSPELPTAARAVPSNEKPSQFLLIFTLYARSDGSEGSHQK